MWGAKVHEDKQTSISKADMLHINAHADVSKGLEPKQFSPHNPGQVVWDKAGTGTQVCWNIVP